MNTIQMLFGEGEKLNMLQMGMRAFTMFFIMLILIRMAGMRTFAKRSSFDSIITIMLGAVLARGVGASPYWSTVAASAVMVILHRVVAWLCVKNVTIEKLVKGSYIMLYNNGTLMKKHLEQSGMSQNDLQESLRLETKKLRFSDVESAFLETNGRISFIKKDKND